MPRVFVATRYNPAGDNISRYSNEYIPDILVKHTQDCAISLQAVGISYYFTSLLNDRIWNQYVEYEDLYIHTHMDADIDAIKLDINQKHAMSRKKSARKVVC